MELVLSRLETETLPESRETFVYSNDPLLNSNYKSAVQENFLDSSKPSIFRVRQQLKFKQFNSINAIGVVLKLSIFIITLSAIF